MPVSNKGRLSVRSVSCCHFFSQVFSSGRGGVFSLNSQPDAWCPSTLGYWHAAHLSREVRKRSKTLVWAA